MGEGTRDTLLVGFTGKKGSGKTTAAQALKGCDRINFKDSLIDEIKENFPDLLKVIKKQLDYPGSIDGMFRLKPPLIRTLLQNYGNDVRRKDDDRYWIKRWLDKVYSTDEDVVTDDVRYLNEAEIVRAVGGIVIRIVRTKNKDVDNHISETEMDKITPDYTVTNDGTPRELSDKIKEIYTKEKTI